MADGTGAAEFHQLARDLGDASDAVKANAVKAVAVTSLKVKTGWNEKLYSAGHAKRTRGTISYDIKTSASEIEGEIGPYVTRVQSGIVKLLELGSRNNGPHGYGAAALYENEADFEHGLDRAVSDAQKSVGL